MRFKKIRSNILKGFILASLFLSQQDKSFAENWHGPKTGPIAQKSKKIIYIASDMQNGGVTKVYRHFEEAATFLEWKITFVDNKGNMDEIKKSLSDSIKQQPDGIILSGIQPNDLSDLINLAKSKKIAVIGWHFGEAPGIYKNLIMNVSTDTNEVAKLAAKYIIKISKGTAGIIIFNDNHFNIANAKVNTMHNEIKKCKKCKILSIENIPISSANTEMPKILSSLNKKYGKTWTHSLAINDIYFDTESERKDLIAVSAGDGSFKAVRRISEGNSQQIATVAEPLNIQGWQLADELNRAFAGENPSGYITKPILVTKEFLKGVDKNNIDYQKKYLKIWGIKSK